MELNYKELEQNSIKGLIKFWNEYQEQIKNDYKSYNPNNKESFNNCFSFDIWYEQYKDFTFDIHVRQQSFFTFKCFIFAKIKGLEL